MFHWKENIFFGRTQDGGVRILAFSSPPELWPVVDGIYDPTDQRFPVIFDKTVDKDGWASVVASVSAGGEVDDRFYTASDFHNSTGRCFLQYRR